jgi:hypothetical protein
MVNRHHQRADKVVAEFKQIIGESMCAQIPDANFQDLTLLIRDAITDELLAAAELIEKVAMKIRRDTDLNQLGL